MNRRFANFSADWIAVPNLTAQKRDEPGGSPHRRLGIVLEDWLKSAGDERSEQITF
jgi:hypothetical protein